MNALMKAARDGDLFDLKTLLKDCDADPNYHDPQTGFTALHTATVWQNSNCAYELLADGRVNPHQRDFAGRRAIDLASGRTLPILIAATYAKQLSNQPASTRSELPLKIIKTYSNDRSADNSKR